MKERPILFSAPMVRAILEGRKTQTRRVVKDLPADVFEEVGRDVLTGEYHFVKGALGYTRACRYGERGDRLWVRETWRPALEHLSECTSSKDVRFAASVSEAEWAISRWRPSIHMPRWASRINLDVIGVRVERLQEISEADALAEGALQPWTGLDRGSDTRTARSEFEALWASINGAESWAANPWVWVVEFKRVTA